MTIQRQSNTAATTLYLVALLVSLPDPCYCQWTCSLFEDPSSTSCSPQKWQVDKVCESRRQEEGGCVDCFDCDPCRAFEYECGACVANGCFWCSGDALCSSTPYTQTEWNHLQEGLQAELHPSCVAVEDWQTTSCESNNSTTPSVAEPPLFSDPLLESMMWLYDMIHVASVWQAGILGKGVHVRVNDIGGVDGTHAEFDNRFDKAKSCENYAPSDEIAANEAEHGTAVASMTLGGANNNQCAVGIAPEASLSACVLPSVGNPLVYATIMIVHLDAIDISVNSWSLESCVQKAQLGRRRKLQACPFSNEFSNSPCEICGTSLSTMTDVAQLSSECRLAIAKYCSSRFEEDPESCSEYLSLYAECDYDSVLTDEERASLEIGTQQGRNGKGIVFVMAAGNFYAYGDSTNGQKWTNTRYTISVGAVDKSGLHASYSVTGSSVFLSAPGGDLDHLTNNVVAKVGGGCHDIGAGTSFSAPVVAGVIALMLEVNSELTWRDVQGILASTSQQVDPEDESWVINAAGFHHSYKYGFGLVHAEAAVEAAKSWEPWPPEEFVGVQSNRINLLIPETEEGDPATTSLFVNTEGHNVQVESVAVLLSIDHPSRGDLEIILTSPQGTKSILHSGPRPENTHLDGDSYWELMTVRSWGEDPQGNWTLSLRDIKTGNLADDCVDIPWNFLLDPTPEAPDGAKVTCSSIGRSEFCKDGQMLNQDLNLLQNADLLSPGKTCCICGGGMAPTENDKLTHWALVVYGRTLLQAEASSAPTGGADATQEASGDDTDGSDSTSGALHSLAAFPMAVAFFSTMLGI